MLELGGDPLKNGDITSVGISSSKSSSNHWIKVNHIQSWPGFVVDYPDASAG